MSSALHIDQRGVLQVFASLSVDKMTAAHKTALRRSLRVLVNETRIQLRGVTARSRTGITSERRGWRGTKKLEDGIRMRVSRDGTMGKVHIMGDFRLKYFEQGTGPRKTKKDINRGKMFRDSKSRPFFDPAINAAKGKMAEAMRKTIVDAVKKRAKQ